MGRLFLPKEQKLSVDYAKIECPIGQLESTILCRWTIPAKHERRLGRIECPEWVTRAWYVGRLHGPAKGAEVELCQRGSLSLCLELPSCQK